MFSIIIPVYNVEDFIIQCLESILRQTHKEFEAIIINDGSTDKSLQKINEFMCKHKDSRFKVFSKQNEGLSDARNYGINYAKNEYLIFVDSDDFIDKNLLLNIKNEIDTYPKLQIIRYPKRIYNEITNEKSSDKVKEFHDINGEEAFLKLRHNRIILETAWTYCIKKAYWIKNDLAFPYKKIHEDIGIIPRTIILASHVSSIQSDAYYNYRIRKNSITTIKNYELEEKKAYDVLSYYINEKKFVDKNPFNNRKAQIEYIEYFSDAVMIKTTYLNKNSQEKLLDWIKDNHLLSNYKTFKAKIKKIIYKIKFYNQLK